MIVINEQELKFKKFRKIIKAGNDEIIIQFKHSKCNVKGHELKIIYLSSYELWISGQLDYLEFLYE